MTPSSDTKLIGAAKWALGLRAKLLARRIDGKYQAAKDYYHLVKITRANTGDAAINCVYVLRDWNGQGEPPKATR